MKFSDRCYSLLSKIPRGKVTTYKEVANALNTKAYRAVGMAMKYNKNSPKIPCHRVICSDGKIGGYFGRSKTNIQKKINILKGEGIVIRNNKIDLDKYLHKLK